MFTENTLSSTATGYSTLNDVDYITLYSGLSAIELILAHPDIASS